MGPFEKSIVIIAFVGLFAVAFFIFALQWGYLDDKMGVQFEYNNYTEEVDNELDIGYAEDEPLDQVVDFYLRQTNKEDYYESRALHIRTH